MREKESKVSSTYVKRRLSIVLVNASLRQAQKKNELQRHRFESFYFITQFNAEKCKKSFESGECRQKPSMM